MAGGRPDTVQLIRYPQRGRYTISNFVDPVRPWFNTLNSSGEYIGIRFGRVDPSSGQVDWVFKPHNEFDGIGAFASILRERGLEIPVLPKLTHPTGKGLGPFFKTVPALMKPRKMLDWNTDVKATSKPDEPTQGAPQAVAWHVFSELETEKIRRMSRRSGVTVNSLLLKHLDRAVRVSLEQPSETVPWMVPVNLRGHVAQAEDTGNHSSYIAIKIKAHDRVQNVHRSIYNKLEREEHWANWKAYELTKSLPNPTKQYLIDTNRAMLQWNVGSFSNLGVWDSEKSIKDEYAAAPWLFCPPVLKCQMIGAGSICFQGRLSIMLQAHPALTTSEQIVSGWVNSWVKQIELDIPSNTPSQQSK